MLVKWIVATVPAPQRRAFHDAQALWRPLAHCEGFEGQVGGWDTDGRGCIVGLWRDAESYAMFMAHSHDAILAADVGPPPFQSLDITTSRAIVRFSGTLPSPVEAVSEARWMRMSDCRIDPSAAVPFVARALRERTVGLRGLEGYLAGSLSVTDADRFFELTTWSTPDVAAGPLPQVRSARAPDAPVLALRAHRVALESEWTILPAR